ncbi:esterase-like activity of phytase family protein [Amycolatopsis sp. CA-230715]|uniref:esterase-like activity of phytase family protein n=1 Tax=Amycolatopsis sp. CA-230715 TaxID=2745196 RepID=UPI001C0187AD|nr:esterase-like activity of phytase family protein [Amycolatopsis sp. CA-230715]
MLCALVLAPSVAYAAEAPAPVCTVKDKRLNELSGLVSDGEHFYAINDGGTKTQVFVLGRDCAVQRVITNAADPYDVEDLARAADGTFWLSDTGDNRKQRDTVALLALTPQGKATLYRLTYPDGQHDTEALLLGRDGTPYLVTKNILGDASVFRPKGKLASPGPTPLENVGSVAIKTTDTEGGPVGALGSLLVTGGATSADGKVVALRTYTDAYLYPAPDGDIAAALKREPVRVPLPGEKQGEAIAFDPDGTLLSGSEGVGEPIKAVPKATDLVKMEPEPSGEAPAAPGGASAAPSGSGPDESTVTAVIVVAAVLVIGFGLFRRSRRR